jgi:cytochrome c-type biogenesis protein CcmH
MRAQIAERLAAGETADEIRAGFVSAYGDSVLMAPPKHGLGAAAYYLPVLVVVLGAVVAITLLRRWRRPEVVDDLPEASAAQRRAVQRAVEQLRNEEPG